MASSYRGRGRRVRGAPLSLRKGAEICESYSGAGSRSSVAELETTLANVLGVLGIPVCNCVGTNVHVVPRTRSRPEIDLIAVCAGETGSTGRDSPSNCPRPDDPASAAARETSNRRAKTGFENRTTELHIIERAAGLRPPDVPLRERAVKLRVHVSLLLPGHPTVPLSGRTGESCHPLSRSPREIGNRA